ncbi:P-loop containing nucleoside triphosphate hydrolase protein [Baffinella frigidus]|nr:P-loop containing nucleoside triphosphate hydrolase protein [Cryptophyta sp. CCMP2293]
MLMKCDGIILAYAGKSLLRSTKLHLARGARYGIVGHNGVGKTTLLNRIAARDISGFPEHINVVYVQHEILANDEQSVIAYMLAAQARLGLREQNDGDVSKVLDEMGFSADLQKSAVLELSGGWRMRLALAGAILSKADLLLLDEPTNHLDVNAVAWLSDYLCQLQGTTTVIVSHDYDFLDKTVTDIVHFSDMQLDYYQSGWTQFAAARPDVIKALPKKKNSSYFAEFPDPGVLDGIKSRLKPIMRLTNVVFRYESSAKDVLKGVSQKLSMSSRVALVGANGAGKTTLLKLLVGDLEMGDGGPTNKGELFKHHNLRVAYIAQHSMHHLEENLIRVTRTEGDSDLMCGWQGQDRELGKMVTMAFTPEDKMAIMKKGNISKIVGRAVRGGELCYQVNKVGFREEQEWWEPMSNIRYKDPYVLKLVKNYDEKMKTVASGVDIRPIHENEIRRHLQDYGIEEDLATSKLKGFSGGQKSRVVLAAAMWCRPHLIALDEPTNYLDKVRTLRPRPRTLGPRPYNNMFRLPEPAIHPATPHSCPLASCPLALQSGEPSTRDASPD